MKEKDRKLLEQKKLIEFTKAVHQIRLDAEYPKKDIGMLIQYHSRLRTGIFEEIMESLLNESLLTRLERYGENSNFWSRNESNYSYAQSKNAKSKRPSKSWLRAKVQRYESEAIKQISAR